MARHVHVVQNRKALSWMLMILLAGFILELVGGWLTNSLGVMSDSFHMLSDGISQLTFWVVMSVALWSHQPPKWMIKRERGHGWSWLLSQEVQRLRLIGDTINLLLLLSTAGYTMIRSMIHLWSGEMVTHATASIWIAVIGLVVNVINLGIFTAFKAKSSMKSVYMHILSDLGFSIIVIISLVLFALNERLFWVDGVLSMVLSIKMIGWSWRLTRELLQNKTFEWQGIMLSFPEYADKGCDHDHDHEGHSKYDRSVDDQ